MGFDYQPLWRSLGKSQEERNTNFWGELICVRSLHLYYSIFQQNFEVDVIIPILQMKILKCDLEIYLGLLWFPPQAFKKYVFFKLKFKNYSWFTTLCQFLLYRNIYIFCIYIFLILFSIMVFPKRWDMVPCAVYTTGPHLTYSFNFLWLLSLAFASG